MATKMPAIPKGWQQVTTGQPKAGDKAWNFGMVARPEGFYPLDDEEMKQPAERFRCLIRKAKKDKYEVKPVYGHDGVGRSQWYKAAVVRTCDGIVEATVFGKTKTQSLARAEAIAAILEAE